MRKNNLGKNKIFHELKSVDWVSKIKLSAKREQEIIDYPDDLSEFNILIETFQQERLDDEVLENNEENDGNIFVEKNKFDRLIVMNDVSGLQDKSNEFSNFLTVPRKFGYTCLYIFHIIYLTKSIWQMILSQNKIFNIFPSAIQLSSMLKILTNNCDRETINYIPARDLWINWLYFSLSNEYKNACLAIDCTKLGPSKYKTLAGSNFGQFCYYRQNIKDRLYDNFLPKRTEENNDCLVGSVINTTKNGEAKFFKPVQKLKASVKNDGRNNDVKRISEQRKVLDKQNGGRRSKNGTYFSFLVITPIKKIF